MCGGLCKYVKKIHCFFHFVRFGGGRSGGGFRGGSGGYSSKGMQPGANLHKPKWENMNLVPFQKNFYEESPSVANKHPVSLVYANVCVVFF